MIVRDGKSCKFCRSTFTIDTWWKCCPTHTSATGDDVVCQRCYEEVHLALPTTERQVHFEILIVIVLVILAFVLFISAVSQIGNIGG